MEQITIPKAEYEELLKYKYAVTVLEEELHEKAFSPSFVESVERVRGEVRQGKKTVFKDAAAMKKHLEEL